MHSAPMPATSCWLNGTAPKIHSASMMPLTHSNSSACVSTSLGHQSRYDQLDTTAFPPPHNQSRFPCALAHWKLCCSMGGHPGGVLLHTSPLVHPSSDPAQYKISIISLAGNLQGTFTPTPDPGFGVRSVAWHPSGMFLAVGGWDDKVGLTRIISNNA